MNVDHAKLAQLLGSMVFSGNKGGAHKVLLAIPDERLGRGTKTFLYILFFPLLFVVGLVRLFWIKVMQRFFNAI